MKTPMKTLLIAIVLAGLVAPCVLVAQAVVEPNPPYTDWLKLHDGGQSTGSLPPFPTPAPQVKRPFTFGAFPTPVPHVGKPPTIGAFPTPVPHVGKPPTIRPSPSPMPTSGTGVLPGSPAPVLVRPNPTLAGPIVIVPFAVTQWDLDQYDQPLPPGEGYGTNLQPIPPHAERATQNSISENPGATADHWEVGMSGTPISNPEKNTWDALVGFHFAYAWNNLYISWDSIAVPEYLVQAWTGGYFDSSGDYVVGYDVPGFLNLWDVGLRLIHRPLVGIVEVGVNSLYVYQQGLLAGGLGANIRLGAGLKFGFWGFSLTETSVYQSWDDLTTVIGGLFSSDNRASSWNRITQSFVSSFQFTFYI